MFHNYAIPCLDRANIVASRGDIAGMWCELRKLPFSDFCQCMHSVPMQFSSIITAIPKIPPVSIQNQYTGHSGNNLMIRSCNAVRLLQVMSYRVLGRNLSGKILDYGCGWGRLLRLMYYFSDPAQTYGVDPMTTSLQLCRQYGVNSNLDLCTTVPQSLPFNVVFDFVYSFSVFTHTSKEATRAILRTVRNVISSNGLFVITIRPIEFLGIVRDKLGDSVVNSMIDEHERTGFSFTPLNLDGKKSPTFGEATMSFEFLHNLARETDWKISNIDTDFNEPFQIFVALTPT